VTGGAEPIVVHVEELKIACKLLDVDYDGFGPAGYGGAR